MEGLSCYRLDESLLASWQLVAATRKKELFVPEAAREFLRVLKECLMGGDARLGGMWHGCGVWRTIAGVGARLRSGAIRLLSTPLKQYLSYISPQGCFCIFPITRRCGIRWSIKNNQTMPGGVEIWNR